MVTFEPDEAPATSTEGQEDTLHSSKAFGNSCSSVNVSD